MRSLAILPSIPTRGPGSGGDRTQRLLGAWRTLGSLDVMVGSDIDASSRSHLVDGVGADRVMAIPEVGLRSNRGRLQWLIERHLAFDIAVTDPRPARARARELIAEDAPYDAVFVSGVPMLWSLRAALPLIPLFLDVPVVGVSRCEAELAALRASGSSPRRLGRRVQLMLERDRWFRFELRYAAAAHLTTIRSLADREALAVPGTVVVPDDDIAAVYPGLVDRVVAAAGRYESKGGS